MENNQYNFFGLFCGLIIVVLISIFSGRIFYKKEERKINDYINISIYGIVIYLLYLIIISTQKM